MKSKLDVRHSITSYLKVGERPLKISYTHTSRIKSAQSAVTFSFLDMTSLNKFGLLRDVKPGKHQHFYVLETNYCGMDHQG